MVLGTKASTHLGNHAVHERLRAVEHSTKIDGHGLGPLLKVSTLGKVLARSATSSIEEQEVNVPEVGEGEVREGEDVLRVRTAVEEGSAQDLIYEATIRTRWSRG